MLGALLVFLGLGFVLPVYLANEVPWFHVDFATAVLFGAVVYVAARLARLAQVGERRLMSLTFWLFTYVWGVLSAFIQVGADVFPWKRAHSDTEQLQAALLLFASLLLYDAGALFARWRERRRPPQDVLVFSLRWTFVFGLVAIATTTLAIISVGGVGVLLQPRGDVSAELWIESGAEVASRNLLEAVLRAAPFVACFTLLYTLLHRWRELTPRSRLLMGALLAAILPLTMITNYPNALSRGWLGTVGLSFIFLLIPWRRWTMPLLIGGLIGAFVFVFPYTDRNRVKSTEARPDMPAKIYASPAWPLMIKGDYDVFVQLVNGIIYVRETDYMYGRNLLGTVLFWFPRRWWPDKPLNSGHVIGFYMHNSVVNLSAPLWLEAYLAFGLLGTVSIMSLYGYLTGVMEHRYVRQGQRGLHWGALQIFLPFWAGYQVFFLRGPLLNSVAYSSFAVLLFVLLARWKTVPIRPAAALQGAGAPQPA